MGILNAISFITSYERCCTLEAGKLEELPKKQLIEATLRSRERYLLSLEIIWTCHFFHQGWSQPVDNASREVILAEGGIARS